MNELYGLAVCGGKSSRMGTDKSLLNYHGMPQRYFLYEMLKPLCEKVFISCNKEQATAVTHQYNLIIDNEKYSGIGPMAGLLSAFEKFPDASFLTIGCDYPFLNSAHLKKLIAARVELQPAISLLNSETEICEPLLSIYERECFPLLLENFKEKKYSLWQFLDNNNSCQVVSFINSKLIKSVDDIESFTKAKEILLAGYN